MAETVSDYFREWVSAWGLKRIFGFLAMASTSCAPTALKPASSLFRYDTTGRSLSWAFGHARLDRRSRCLRRHVGPALS